MVTRPKQCENCGKGNCRIVGHHEDYSMPDVLTFLCNSCHGKLHAYRKRAGIPIGPRPKRIASFGQRIISCALPKAEAKKVKEAAEADRRSVSNWLRGLILKALEKTG